LIRILDDAVVVDENDMLLWLGVSTNGQAIWC